MRGIRGLATLVAASLVVGVVACGGDDAQAEAQRVVLGAAQATFAQGSAQVLLTLDGDEGEGLVDFEALQSQVDIDLDDDPTTVIVDGVDVFAGDGDTFTQDLDGLPDLATIILFLQPLQALQILNGADPDEDIEIVGEEEVDGVTTTHYQVVIDLQAALDSLEGDQRDALQAAIDRLGSDTLTVDVWIGEDGVVRRLSSTIGDVDLQLDFSDFGREVRIRVPRPRAVVETARELALATADISGTWSSTGAIVSSTNTTQAPIGPVESSRFDLSCRPSGDCTNAESGNAWSSSGPGRFVVVAEETAACTDNVTGEVLLENSATTFYRTVWTVTEVDDEGRVVAMTSTGTIRGEVNAAGRARNCPWAGGGFTYTAERTGEATRTD